MLIAHEFQVGVYTCTMTADLKHNAIRAVWDPRKPVVENLSEEDLAQYRHGRDELMRLAAIAMGGAVGVIEPRDDGTVNAFATTPDGKTHKLK